MHTIPVTFVNPPENLMGTLCNLVDGLRAFITKQHPGLHVSQFVSPAGLRRGIVVSPHEVPHSFVLMTNAKNEALPEQMAFLTGSLVVYVGAVDDTHAGIKPAIPLDDPNDLLEGIAYEIALEFRRLCEATVPTDQRTPSCAS